MVKSVKVAILDLYNGEPNQGMRCIRDIVNEFKDQVSAEVFDVRAKNEIPGTDHDIYICSGGPGNPLEGDGIWDKQFYQLIHDLWNWNISGKFPKKHVFFICHSFQMACHLFGVGTVTTRKSEAFGVFPIHKTETGKSDELLKNLPNPFFGADFRTYQVISPLHKRLEDLASNILALEKIRPHIALERAVMAIRFSDEFFGVQFHPEADAEGMIKHFSEEKSKKAIIETNGIEKYEQIMQDLKNPERVELTQNTLLPGFIKNAISKLKKEKILLHQYKIKTEYNKYNGIINRIETGTNIVIKNR